MRHIKGTKSDAFLSALEAISNLLQEGFVNIDTLSSHDGLMAHVEIEHASVPHKAATFYRHFVPLRQQFVVLLGEAYRRYFKLALAQPSRAANDPDEWGQMQLQPAIRAVFEWIHQWYILACDGQNEGVRHVGTIEFVPASTVSVPIPTTVPPLPPPTSWRAPSWLFEISPLVGIGPLKENHGAVRDTEDKLGEAHTRLLLKGARRVFLWELAAVCRTVRNEETAAAGAVVAATVRATEGATEKKHPKVHLKGTEGLVCKKNDLSQWMHNLTDKQQLAFSLKFEYGLGLAEIASRMELDRKTAYEHIEAAKRKIDQTRSAETKKRNRAKIESE